MDKATLRSLALLKERLARGESPGPDFDPLEYAIVSKMAEETGELLRELSDIVARAVKFAAPPEEWLPEAGESTEEMHLLPYDETYVQVEGHGILLLSPRAARDFGLDYDRILSEDPGMAGQHAVALSFTKDPRHGMTFGGFFAAYRADSDGALSVVVGPLPQGYSDRLGPTQLKNAEWTVQTACRFLALLNCGNITVKAPRANFPHVGKEDRGPRFAYRVLVLRAPTRAVVYNQGEALPEEFRRASPRFHLRRGHIRRHKNGKTIFIGPTMVGDPTRGTVVKDYEVRLRRGLS